MFNVGDKVVPIGKSAGKTLEHCNLWKQAKESGQNYLVITSINLDDKITCTLNRTSYGGDYFLQEDLIPFEEVVKLTKGNIVSIKELIDLVDKGILRETDLFHITRA